MKSCLLCLQVHTGFNDYISINSPQWLKLKILSTIEKHFWPIDNVQNIFGVCFLCWSKISDFNEFYRTIEEAHYREVKISLEEEMLTNASRLETEVLQSMTSQIFRTEFTSTQESNFTTDEFGGDIKIEETFKENETLLCINTTNVHNDMDINPISIKKRKRGRPPKKLNFNELLTKNKPKGKRGRPRKYVLELSDKHTNKTSFRNYSNAGNLKNVNQILEPFNVDLILHSNYTNERRSSEQTNLVKTTKRGRPPKVKRSRGRPRKIQVNKEIPNDTTAVHDIALPNIELLIREQCPTVQEGKEIKDVSNLNGAEKLEHKKKKIPSLLKKRKRANQHKALMRNYIATSVRCMKFLKK